MFTGFCLIKGHLVQFVDELRTKYLIRLIIYFFLNGLVKYDGFVPRPITGLKKDFKHCLLKLCTCMHVNIYMHTHRHTHTQACASHTHTHAHTHTHTHTHSLTLKGYIVTVQKLVWLFSLFVMKSVSHD